MSSLDTFFERIGKAFKSLKKLVNEEFDELEEEVNLNSEYVHTKQRKIYIITKEDSLLLKIVIYDNPKATYSEIADICSDLYGFTPSRYIVAGFKHGTLRTSMCVK